MVYDVGGSAIKCAVMSENGKIIQKGKLHVPDTFEAFVDSLIAQVDKYRSTFNLQGIAISSPGAVNQQTGIIEGSSAIPYIHGPNIRQILSEKAGLPVSIENDANCAALGEGWLGIAKEYSYYAAVVCGTGIGGAIVKEGKVEHGAHLHGGEFGYAILDPVNFTSWSHLGAIGGLVRNFAKNAGMNAAELDGRKIFEMAEQGDALAAKEIDLYFHYMALGLFNLQYTIDPEIIVLGGAISERPGFIDRINEKMTEIFEHNPESKIVPQLKLSMNGNDSNLIGALFNFLNTQQ